MFRTSSAHLQEDTVVYMQHMAVSHSMRVRGGLSVHSLSENRQATTNSRREWHCHMLHVYSCILLKMSTWGSKHVKENNILWINNNQCIKLVINICNQMTVVGNFKSLFITGIWSYIELRPNRRVNVETTNRNLFKPLSCYVCDFQESHSYSVNICGHVHHGLYENRNINV